jgi:hypothetical protein
MRNLIALLMLGTCALCALSLRFSSGTNESSAPVVDVAPTVRVEGAGEMATTTRPTARPTTATRGGTQAVPSAPTVATAATEAAPLVRVVAASANVRQGPGTAFAVVGTARAGDELTAVGQAADGSWYLVVLANGAEGWIGSSLVELVDPAGLVAVPVAATVPAASELPPATQAVGVEQSAPTLAPAPTLALETAVPAAVCDCSGDRYKCDSFPLTGGVSAQQCFDYCVAVGAGDIHRLDGNNNGEACEG